ncbi:MAG: serine/threonine-protein kinase, partial [Planctomycetota bacterium]
MSKNKQTIPGFTLKKKLGAGGMGSVYKAVQQSLDREVAIKVMPIELAENPEFRERFFREAKAAGRLNHPNIVQGIDAGEAGPYCWIAMELVNGPSVADLLKERERFGETEALAIVTDIARALEHAASHGIIHRDVKPENFLRAANGVTKLCDLGIAKAAAEDTGLTQEGRAVGTPRYISPEQARGEQNIDARADIYSLGASWYHLLTGQPPFDGPTAAVVMTKHITDEPEPIQDLVDEVSPHTVRVIARMMAKDKEKRYPGLAELLVDLEALARGELPRGALATSVPGGASRSKRRRAKGERKGGGKTKGEKAARNGRTGTGKTAVNRAAGRAGA